MRAPTGWRTEVQLATIWGDLLRLEHVSGDADFFESGGHSLLAARIISRVRSVFHIDLPLRALFETPTVAGLATAIDEAKRRGTSSAAPTIVPVARKPGAQRATST